MTTLREAAEIVATQARKRGMKVQQVDPVTCEAHPSITFYVYGDGDDYTYVNADLPSGYNIDGEFLFSEWRAAFMALIPADVLSEHAWS